MWYPAFSEFSSEWWQHGDVGFKSIENGLKFQTCTVMDNSGDLFFKQCISSVQSLSRVHSVMSSSLRPHGLQHTRLACPSPTPGACSNSCPLSRWCHPNISSSHPLLLLPSILRSIRVFSNELVLWIRWPKYWSFSFSISPSNGYSGLIFFRMDWLDLLAWVAIPFSRRSSWPRNWMLISCIAGRFFSVWATREAHTPTQEGTFSESDSCLL